MRKKCTSIGGQAVIEGVMMRGVKSVATAVRDDKGKIVIESKRVKPIKEKSFWFRVPIIRGVLNFFGSMISGMGCLLRSGEVFGDEGEPSKFENWLAKKCGVDVYDIVMGFSVILGVALAVLLFVFLPSWIIDGVKWIIGTTTGVDQTSIAMGWNVLYSFVEGLVRIGIFIGYIALTTLMKDVKRTYMYHGAEHKTINCYENDLELTVENARKMTKQHDRCGTSFMFIVMVISVLVLSCFSWLNVYGQWVKLLVRLALIPLIMGISYEVLKGLAKYDNKLVRALKAPGLMLQKLTTKEPTDDMLEVAIAAFKTVYAMDQDPTIPEQKFDVKILLKKVKAEFEEKLKTVNADSSEVEWILSIAMGIKRSELASKTQIQQSQYDKAKEILEKRLTGMPLWKVIGNTDFYGVEIDINEDVLAPRPETEELVEKVLHLCKDGDNILDLCTGSGCIAIAVAMNKNVKVIASDISNKALKVASNNIKKNKIEDKISIIESDLFDKIEGKFDIIVSNPPYIPTNEIEKLDVEVKKFDPLIALDGGLDGLDFYKKIIAQVENYLNSKGYVLFECGEHQAEEIAKMMVNFEVEICKDLEGVERIIIAKLK